MFHLEYFKSQIATGATTRAQITSVYNQMIPTLNNGFQVPPALSWLAAVMGVGSGLVQVQIQTPRFQPFPYPNFVPNNRGTAFESPPRIWDFFRNPYQLTPTDELDCFASQNSGGNATPVIAVLFSDGVVTPIPNGPRLSVHWTAATTLTAGAFTSVQPVLDSALPAGNYALIGARVFSATCLFFQMLPANPPNWRPGGIGVQAYDQLDPPGQRGLGADPGSVGSWGTWLNFRQNTPPQINIYASSADTAEEGWLDLVFMGP